MIKVKLLKEKKCAFITMDSKESAAEALHQLHDKTLIDRRLTINFAKVPNHALATMHSQPCTCERQPVHRHSVQCRE